jgi:cbb3-type cytochrome oxidase subunit 3
MKVAANSVESDDNTFLRKQAWDYFDAHASQRMSIFNFYIALSSITATTYAAAWKADSNLQSARGLLAFLLLLFSFVFWKFDQRNKALIKNAERALMAFEAADSGDQILKVFTQEHIETTRKRAEMKGLQRLQVWKWALSYSDCFNTVFSTFALIGGAGLVEVLYRHFDLGRWWLPVRNLL